MPSPQISRTLLALIACSVLGACDQSPAPTGALPASPIATRPVEAGCGQCLFGLPGGGCTLAVRFDGTAYYVEGSSIDDHGDAHASDGLCNVIRTADASGRLEQGVFLSERIVLRPAGEVASP